MCPPITGVLTDARCSEAAGGVDIVAFMQDDHDTEVKEAQEGPSREVAGRRLQINIRISHVRQHGSMDRQ